MMRSSILGREFVNFRKNTITQDRKQFSDKVRGEGMGNIPIVVDSVDGELSEALSIQVHSRLQSKYGRELVKHMDQRLSSVIRDIKVILLQKDRENLISNFVLCLEDGTIPDQETEVGNLYKAHRNKDDRILYLMLSKENSVYEYIMSIVRYLGQSIWSVLYLQRK